MTDMKDWPLVPVDPVCVPEGYEPVMIRTPVVGDQVVWCGANTISKAVDVTDMPLLIIRPIPKPIRLPTTIVPPGWWVARDDEDRTWIYRDKPTKTSSSFINDKATTYRVPPPIAAQLPAEYLALSWDKSLMQQTEGM